MSNNKLINDYNEFKQKRPLGITGGPIDINKFDEWEITIPGPVNSPYEGGKFKVKISFPSDFPNSPPTCIFDTKVFHPNINFQTGYICVNFLKKGTEDEKKENKKTWTNKLTVCKIVVGLYGLLKSPNQTDPLNHNAHSLYVRDPPRYFKLAKNFTNKFAK